MVAAPSAVDPRRLVLVPEPMLDLIQPSREVYGFAAGESEVAHACPFGNGLLRQS